MAAPGISQRWVNVDLLTTEYRLVGKTLVGSSGLYGTLIDQTKSFIEIRQAQVAYLRSTRRVIRQFASACILKAHIYAACLEMIEYAGPQSVSHGGYTTFQSYPVHVAFSSFEMECLVKWAGRFEISAVLAESMGKFLQVYDVRIQSSIIPGFGIENPAALVNMSQVDLMATPPEPEKRAV